MATPPKNGFSGTIVKKLRRLRHNPPSGNSQEMHSRSKIESKLSKVAVHGVPYLKLHELDVSLTRVLGPQKGSEPDWGNQLVQLYDSVIMD